MAPIVQLNFILKFKAYQALNRHQEIQHTITCTNPKSLSLIGDQQIAKRKNEKFKRIKCSTLARLLKESIAEESIYNLNDGGAGAAGAAGANMDEVGAADSISQVGAQNYSAASKGVSYGKDNQSVYSGVTGASGVSAASHVTYATDMLGITQNTTFLLLDLRPPEEHAEWHIRESINFPAVNIARDKTIPELFRFKNAPDKLIIIYMLDERQGVSQAQLLCEKGYENVFLLSGGCEAFLEDYQNLCEGVNIPIPKK